MPAKRNAAYKVTRLDNCQSSGHGLGDQRLNMLHHDCGAPEGHERLPRVMDSELRMLREVRSALEARSIKELLVQACEPPKGPSGARPAARGSVTVARAGTGPLACQPPRRPDAKQQIRVGGSGDVGVEENHEEEDRSPY